MLKPPHETIAEFNREHAQPGRKALFVLLLEECGFTEQHIARIIEVVRETCHYCWDAPSRCQCWNDE